MFILKPKPALSLHPPACVPAWPAHPGSPGCTHSNSSVLTAPLTTAAPSCRKYHSGRSLLSNAPGPLVQVATVSPLEYCVGLLEGLQSPPANSSLFSALWQERPCSKQRGYMVHSPPGAYHQISNHTLAKKGHRGVDPADFPRVTPSSTAPFPISVV